MELIGNWIPHVALIFCRFRILFVNLFPCASLVTLNIMLFRAMKEAEKRRARLLNSNQRVNPRAGGSESRDSKKIRDSNRTTLMLIVVISVSKMGPNF